MWIVGKIGREKALLIITCGSRREVDEKIKNVLSSPSGSEYKGRILGSDCSEFAEDREFQAYTKKRRFGLPMCRVVANNCKIYSKERNP